MLIRSAVTLSLVFFLCSCGEWKTKRQSASPDGKAVAVLQVKLRGASSTDGTRIAVENAPSGSLLKPGRVLEADGAIVSETRLKWESPDRLIVQLCEARSYEVRSKLLRDPVTRDSGEENAIEVEVTNLHYSEEKRRCQ